MSGVIFSPDVADDCSMFTDFRTSPSDTYAMVSSAESSYCSCSCCAMYVSLFTIWCPFIGVNLNIAHLDWTGSIIFDE